MFYNSEMWYLYVMIDIKDGWIENGTEKNLRLLLHAYEPAGMLITKNPHKMNYSYFIIVEVNSLIVNPYPWTTQSAF